MKSGLSRALALSAIVHAALLVFLARGQDAIDSTPNAVGGGLGPRGDFKVVALSTEQANRLLARRGPPRVAMLIEAGGRGRATEVLPELLSVPRPPGPQGLGLAGGATLLDLSTGRSGVRDSTVVTGPGPLGLPDSLPAAPTPLAGAPADPSEAASDQPSEPTEGPDAAGQGELAGSAGQQAIDAGAADGDRAIGLDAATADGLMSFKVSPYYPPELALAGIGGRARIEFTVNGNGRVRDIRLVSGTGNSDLDLRAERALRRSRFSVDLIAARGFAGRRFRITYSFLRHED